MMADCHKEHPSSPRAHTDRPTDTHTHTYTHVAVVAANAIGGKSRVGPTPHAGGGLSDTNTVIMTEHGVAT